MRRKIKSKKMAGSLVGVISTILLFFVMFLVLMFGIQNIAGGADEEGVSALKSAIERATVLCYATEGYYPPSLDYIEDNYGVQIDSERYAVRYEVYAANIMPAIRVAVR